MGTGILRHAHDVMLDEDGMLAPPDVRIERFVCMCVFMPPRNAWCWSGYHIGGAESISNAGIINETSKRPGGWLFGKLPSSNSYITQHSMLTSQQMPVTWKTKWISMKQLRIFDKEIGSGNFGYVRRGEYDDNGTWMEVAVKQLKLPNNDEEFEKSVTNFMKELAIMIRVGDDTTSEHVIKLIGFCTECPNPTVIVELACGSLEDFLKRKAKFNKPQARCGNKKEHELYIDDANKCHLCQTPPFTYVG